MHYSYAAILIKVPRFEKRIARLAHVKPGKDEMESEHHPKVAGKGDAETRPRGTEAGRGSAEAEAEAGPLQGLKPRWRLHRLKPKPKHDPDTNAEADPQPHEANPWTTARSDT